MKTMPARVLLHWIFSTILVMAGIIYTASAAHAADAQPPPSLALPSSSQPAMGNWTKMHPSSFAGTIKSAHEQCVRDADYSETDLLTKQTCQKFQDLLDGGFCEVVMVPDGIVHDFMNGRTNGTSVITRNVKKQIGRTDRAFLCDLGDGVYGYWYTGIPNQSCNNVAFSFVKPAPVPPPAPQGEWVCVQVPAGETLQSVVGHQLEGFVLQNDCCCGEELVIRSHNFHLGSTLQSSGYTEHCFIPQTKKEPQK